MKYKIIPFLIAINLTLTSCFGPLLRKSEENDSILIAADPMCEETPGWITEKDARCIGVEGPPDLDKLKADPAANKKYVAKLVNESQFLCGRFINSLVVSSVGVHGDLDLATTVFSALGTAFSPIATVHALTAAATVSSGWKTAIDSDLYAQATIANYAQVIQSTYYADINSYIKELEKVKDSDVEPTIEMTKIRPIHKECSLASAQAAIHASLQPSSNIVVATPTTITVQSVKAKDTFEISGTYGTPAVAITTKGVTASAKDSKNDIAEKLYQALISAQGFQASGVKASVQGNIITLTGGNNISWKSTGTGVLVISGAETSTSPTVPKSSSDATTSSKTPGHGVGK
jgi:hypothetical protein